MRAAGKEKLDCAIACPAPPPRQLIVVGFIVVVIVVAVAAAVVAGCDWFVYAGALQYLPPAEQVRPARTTETPFVHRSESPASSDTRRGPLHLFTPTCAAHIRPARVSRRQFNGLEREEPRLEPKVASVELWASGADGRRRRGKAAAANRPAQ